MNEKGIWFYLHIPSVNPMKRRVVYAESWRVLIFDIDSDEVRIKKSGKEKGLLVLIERLAVVFEMHV